MKFLDKLVERKIDKLLSADLGKIDFAVKELDDKQGELKRLISIIEERIKGMEDMANHLEMGFSVLERAVSVKENIDTIMLSNAWLRKAYWNYAESIKAKTQEYNPSTNDWQERIISFEISLEKSLQGRVTQGIGIGIKAVKFMKGNGYGTYGIYVNGVRRSWFVKRKGGNEDGAIFLNQLLCLRETDVFEIKQETGEGSLTCNLFIIVAGNEHLFLTNNFLNIHKN